MQLVCVIQPCPIGNTLTSEYRSCSKLAGEFQIPRGWLRGDFVFFIMHNVNTNQLPPPPNFCNNAFAYPPLRSFGSSICPDRTIFLYCFWSNKYDMLTYVIHTVIQNDMLWLSIITSDFKIYYFFSGKKNLFYFSPTKLRPNLYLTQQKKKLQLIFFL